MALCAASLLAAGCGDDDSGKPRPSTGGGGGAAGAKATFASTCGGCHTLSDAGTSGGIGPNLDELKPSHDQVLKALATGPGVMPDKLLSGAEAEAMAGYVSSVTR
jgi:mono/diheme cytochrome c family protein